MPPNDKLYQSVVAAIILTSFREQRTRPVKVMLCTQREDVRMDGSYCVCVDILENINAYNVMQIFT